MRLLLLLLSFTSLLFSQNWDVPEMFKVTLPHHVKVSPDGRQVLYVLKKANVEDKKAEWKLKLYISDCDGKNSRPFSQKDVLTAEWAPDGKNIAFLAKEPEKKSVLWLLPLGGGESEALTDGSQDVHGFAFSPDSKQIAFLMKELPTEEEKKKKEEKNDPYVVDESEKNTHLWLVDLATKKIEKLTSGNFSVGTGLCGEDFDWSCDGQEIAFPRIPCPGGNQWSQTELWTVNVCTKEIKKVETGGFAMMPQYSPDGKWLAYIRASDPFKWQGLFTVAIISRESGDQKNLGLAENNHFNNSGALIGWSENSRSVYALEPLRTKNQVYEIPIDGSPAKKISFGESFISEVNLNKGHRYFGFVGEDTECPPEVYVRDLSGDTIQITHCNEDLPQNSFGCTEVIHYRGKDGLPLEALLTYPKGYKKGTCYPLLLIIHGGPTSLYQEKFIGRPAPYPIAAFSSRGFAVLRCNIRGSDGYGEDFRLKNYKDWAGGDFHDLMAGVDHLIDAGVADPDQLGVMGWSYGGYMTAWIITQTHRFKAASCGAGVVNLVSMFGTTDVNHFMTQHLGGVLWDNYDLYLDRSAISHIKGVTTPTLIQHGQNDERVPLSQSYELYNALKLQGVPTKFIIYPRSPHSVHEPKLLLDVARSNYDWFTHYVKQLKD